MVCHTLILLVHVYLLEPDKNNDFYNKVIKQRRAALNAELAEVEKMEQDLVVCQEKIEFENATTDDEEEQLPTPE